MNKRQSDNEFVKHEGVFFITVAKYNFKFVHFYCVYEKLVRTNINNLF